MFTERAERVFDGAVPVAAGHAADLALIGRCLKGEAAACSALYHKYYRNVMPICLRYAIDMEEAKDILQDSFTRAFSGLHGYAGKGAFIGWLKRVTLNTAINHYHANAEQRSTVRIGDLAQHSPVTIDPNGDLAMARLGADELLGLVQTLPPAYRMVFNLRVMDEWTHEEIARELGISIGTSKSNLSRARAKLMEQLIARGVEYRTQHTAT